MAYEKLIPHNLETTPLELKLDITDSTVDVVFSLAFVPDGYDIDDLPISVLSISQGSNHAIISSFCGSEQNLFFKSSQFENGWIFWNVTKTSDELLFDFGGLGRTEHRVDERCNFNAPWVLFKFENSDETVKEVSSLYYKSTNPGKHT